MPRFFRIAWISAISSSISRGSGFVRRRTSDEPQPRKRPTEKAKAVGPTKQRDPLIDDEMAEIQAILKKRGIS